MSPYAKSVLSVAANLGLVMGLDWWTNGAIDPVAFLAGSALWWGVRAYYLAEENADIRKRGEPL